MWGFLKSTDAILGSGGTVVLPEIDANIFHHEAELVVVFGRAGSNIPQAQAMDYVFGYTAGVDVSARMPPSGAGGGRDRTKMPISAGKSYNGFAPLGPSIVPKDEVGDAQALDIKLWVNGELRPNYNTSDLAHSIAESIAWATAITPVEPGDVLFMGTNHQGLGALQDGDHGRDGDQPHRPPDLQRRGPVKAPLAARRRRGHGRGRAQRHRRPGLEVKAVAVERGITLAGTSQYEPRLARILSWSRIANSRAESPIGQRCVAPDV